MLIRTLLFATENTSEYVNSPWRALDLRTRTSASTRLSLLNLLLLLSISIREHTSVASRAILSNFFGEQGRQNHPQYLSGLSRVLFPTTSLETAVYGKQLMSTWSGKRALITSSFSGFLQDCALRCRCCISRMGWFCFKKNIQENIVVFPKCMLDISTTNSLSTTLIHLNYTIRD